MRWLFNFGVNLAAVIIFIVLYIVSLFGVGKRNRVGKIFSTLLLFTLLNVTVNMIYYLLLVFESTDYTLYYLTSSLRHIFTFAGSATMLLYFNDYFNIAHRVKVATGVTVISLGLIYSILILINVGHPIFYYFNLSLPFKGYHLIQLELYPFIHSLTFAVYIVCVVLGQARKQMSLSERISFFIFPILLGITLFFNIFFRDYSIYSFGLIAAFLFHFLFYFIQRGQIINKQENELAAQQVNIMISQIQPHFIYNCLSAISYLCTQDGKKAQTAIEDFSKYLRGNFSNISNIRIVPFTRELEHTQAYLRLEKMRFDDRVNIVYDIKVKDFVLPSLTLQPIVENAVKHGICKKPEGGTVVISTWENADSIYIRVKDDGIGFDINAPLNEDDRAHIGLNNVESRLIHMSFGKITIDSKINIGTTVTIELPKHSKNSRGGGVTK